MDSDSRVKLPDDPPAAPEPAARRKLAPKTTIMDMADAPLDGKPVILTDGVTEVEAIYRNTRVFDKMLGRWVPAGYWARRNSGGQGVHIEPTGWRPAV